MKKMLVYMVALTIKENHKTVVFIVNKQNIFNKKQSRSGKNIKKKRTKKIKKNNLSKNMTKGSKVI